MGDFECSSKKKADKVKLCDPLTIFSVCSCLTGPTVRECESRWQQRHGHDGQRHAWNGEQCQHWDDEEGGDVRYAALMPEPIVNDYTCLGMQELLLVRLQHRA